MSIVIAVCNGGLAQDAAIEDDSGYPGWPSFDWKTQHPDAVGSVRSLVIDDALPNVRPSAIFELTRDVGHVQSLKILPDGAHIVALTTDDDGSNLRLIRLNGMKIIKELLDLPFWSPSANIQISPDGSRIVFQSVFNMPILIFDGEGESIATIGEGEQDFERNPITFCLSQDGASILTSYVKGRFCAYATNDGAMKRDAFFADLRESGFSVPLRDIGEESILLVELLKDESHRAMVLNLESETIARSKPIPSAPTTCARDGDSMLVANVSRRWQGYELWNAVTLDKLRSIDLEPQISTLDLQMIEDRDLILLLEYMIQPIVLYRANTGRPLGLIQPPGGGCATFDISPDGRWVAAVVGRWQTGTLVSSHVAIYDLKTFLDSLAIDAAAPTPDE